MKNESMNVDYAIRILYHEIAQIGNVICITNIIDSCTHIANVFNNVNDDFINACKSIRKHNVISDDSLDEIVNNIDEFVNAISIF